MSFGSLNYLAIVIAAVAAFALGAVYYGALGKPWMKAARIDPATHRQTALPMPLLLLTSIVCELVMAVLLAGLIGHLSAGDPTLKTGVITGFFVWLGFMATTLTVNQRYQGFGWTLTLIDSVHWLLVALAMGAILGWMG